MFSNRPSEGVYLDSWSGSLISRIAARTTSYSIITTTKLNYYNKLPNNKNKKVKQQQQQKIKNKNHNYLLNNNKKNKLTTTTFYLIITTTKLNYKNNEHLPYKDFKSGNLMNFIFYRCTK